MTRPENPRDVIVIGAGPAGATAAAVLARRGCDVALYDAARYPRDVPCAGWLSAMALPVLQRIGVKLDGALSDPSDIGTFHNADVTKAATPKFAAPPGYLIDRATLDQRIATAAVDAGATFHDNTRVADIALGESTVAVTPQNAEPEAAKLLVLAAGRSTPLIERLRLPRGLLPAGWWAAQVEVQSESSEPTVGIVLGLDDAGGFGVIATAHGRGTISVHTSADRSSVVATLTTLCKNALDQGLIKDDIAPTAARATPIPTPAEVALAMDSHVAKRTLVIGDAGGFVAATSGEGIYPAMWSAHIAADVIHEALQSTSPQDVLMQFDTRWRTEMADHLKPPNTDTQYILPLVFSNQPVADRMGAAFFAGENI